MNFTDAYYNIDDLRRSWISSPSNSDLGYFIMIFGNVIGLFDTSKDGDPYIPSLQKFLSVCVQLPFEDIVHSICIVEDVFST